MPEAELVNYVAMTPLPKIHLSMAPLQPRMPYWMWRPRRPARRRRNKRPSFAVAEKISPLVPMSRAIRGILLL